mmetsp:Transcript_6507/g.26381  ORF Transcript_6507/g.26381 Transcript_6507/m.26381 type:complete len:210 (+) Transcript_6507:613-1242(+)
MRFEAGRRRRPHGLVNKRRGVRCVRGVRGLTRAVPPRRRPSRRTLRRRLGFGFGFRSGFASVQRARSRVRPSRLERRRASVTRASACPDVGGAVRKIRVRNAIRVGVAARVVIGRVRFGRVLVGVGVGVGIGPDGIGSPRRDEKKSRRDPRPAGGSRRVRLRGELRGGFQRGEGCFREPRVQVHRRRGAQGKQGLVLPEPVRDGVQGGG